MNVQLDRPPSLPDGSKVNVIVRKAKLSTSSEREAKLRELFGGCSQDAAELDSRIQWNQEQRRISSPVSGSNPRCLGPSFWRCMAEVLQVSAEAPNSRAPATKRSNSERWVSSSGELTDFTNVRASSR